MTRVLRGRNACEMMEGRKRAPMGTPRSFGDYVTMRRQQRGYSIRQLAKRVDVAPTTITRIVDGSVPHPDLFLALVDILDLDIITAVKLIEPYHRLYQRINQHDRDDQG